MPPVAVQHTNHADPEVLKRAITALEEAIPGGVSSGIFDRKAMASDASHYLLTPEIVVRPKNSLQVGDLFRISQRENIGMTFRSGGTSLSGQSISSGLLIDVRRNFREMEVLGSGAQVRVQPGVTIRQVNMALAKFDRKLGPDPASEIACTVGGIVANNSSGMTCGTAFNTYSTMHSLTFVLPSGTVIDSGSSDADEKLKLLEPSLYEGLLRLRRRILARQESIEKIRRLYSIKNTMGYSLNSFVDYSRPVDILSHLIVGSEGTLAFIAEITYNTVPLLQELATGFLIFENMADATNSLAALKVSNAAVIELLDSTSLAVAQREHMADSVLGDIVFRDQAALLVEYQANHEDELNGLIAGAERLFAELPIAPTSLSRNPRTRNELWHARKGLYTAVAGNRPPGVTVILEDIAVPMAALHETVSSLEILLRKHNYLDSVIFGHAKDGNIHFLLKEQFDRPEMLERYQAFTEDMVTLVLGHGGSLKAEHGTGRIMAPYVRRQFGDELHEVMVEIKNLCDPCQLLNPGVLINADPSVHIKDLKINPVVDSEVDRCVECGYCEPVCPSRDLTLTPRQRIVLWRALAEAKNTGDVFTAKELEGRFEYDMLQTCAADGMCATACPVRIDTGALVRRQRAEDLGSLSNRAGNLAARHWKFLTFLGAGMLNIAKKMSPNLLLSINSLGRKVAGAEVVPLWNPSLPRGGSVRTGIFNPIADVLYFPSCVNSLLGPSEGESGVQAAFLALCNQVGIEVAIPEDISDLCCGTPWKSKGLASGYKEIGKRTMVALLKHAQESISVVCDSTSCSQGLAELLEGSSDVIRVQDTLLYVEKWILPKLDIKKKIPAIALHPTCSSVQLGLTDAMSAIAHAVADEVFIPKNWACCGFAGDRGMLHPELTESATALEAKELSSRSFTKYASANRPCEIAMSQATGRIYVHLLEVLADSSRP